jgi:hypothetical protein
MHIEKEGGAQSMGGTSSNAINSISASNPKRENYLEKATRYMEEQSND